MQVYPSQVIVQVAPASLAGAGLPVFNITTARLDAPQGVSVRISALARAMAGVAPTGAGPQLSLAVSYAGSFGTSMSFTPFAPAAAAAELYAGLAGKGESRAPAGEAAQVREAGTGPEGGALAGSVEVVSPPVPAPAPVSVYRAVAAEAGPVTVDVSA